MSDVAVRVENLSKRYRIGRKEETHDTMVGAVTGFVRRPMHDVRRLRRLTRFGSYGHDAEDIIWALKDVSFEVKQGEVLGTVAPRCGCIIGRNGAGTPAPSPSAGQSTLLKILSRNIDVAQACAQTGDGNASSPVDASRGTDIHSELIARDTERIYLNWVDL